jgi:hypothetical protein
LKEGQRDKGKEGKRKGLKEQNDMIPISSFAFSFLFVLLENDMIPINDEER